MRIKMIIPILAVFLVLGCIEQAAEETKLQVYQGLGILSFGMPTATGTASVEVERVTPGSPAFLAMVVRNNAEGGMARDVKVSLDGIEPFKITECGEEFDATEYRTESNCYTGVYTDVPEDCQESGENCLQYRTHSMDSINPDEEMIFFWTLKSPSSDIIANMYYEQEMTGILEYHYHTSVYVGISSMNFNEYSSRQAQGMSLSGTTTSSAGPIRVSSTTNEPVLYSGGTQGFVLKLKVENQGNGIPLPNKNMILTVEYDDSILDFTGQGGLMSEADSDDEEWFEEEYGEQAQELKILKMEISPIMLSQAYTLSVPFDLKRTNINYQIIPFYVRISYEYEVESSSKIGVVPLK